MENVLEWIDGDDTITATLHQRRYVNRIRRLAKERPDDVKIIAENPDGTILARFPLKYLIIRRSVEYTEEERELLAERARLFLKEYWKSKRV